MFYMLVHMFELSIQFHIDLVQVSNGRVQLIIIFAYCFLLAVFEDIDRRSDRKTIYIREQACAYEWH